MSSPSGRFRCREPRREPGGGGINVARVLRRFGTASTALYPAGGATGELLHRLLDGEGIESRPVEIAGDTRENVMIREAATGNQFRFVLPGPEHSAAEWERCIEAIAGSPAATYIVASGSLPPGVPADIYREIVRTAAGRGSRVIVDTSGEALAAALEAGVYLVKPNLRELSDLIGRALETEADWRAASLELVEAGAAEVVALSLGNRGAMLVSRKLRLYAPAVPVDLVSAVGAGDSFVAGMVWQLAAGADLRDAFACGVAAGTAALLTPGSELCRPDDVARLRAEVRLREV